MLKVSRAVLIKIFFFNFFKIMQFYYVSAWPVIIDAIDRSTERLKTDYRIGQTVSDDDINVKWKLM